MSTSRSTNKSQLGHPWIVAIILFISLVLRWILALRGGQYYFSDEQRYETSRAFVNLLLQGSFREAFSQFFIAPEHLGFKFIGIIPALVETLTIQSLLIPALFFSLFSVFNIYLIYRIAKRTNTSEKVALYALILASVSMSLLYYARHLMPYDPAMTFGLIAVYIALTDKPTNKTSLACGAMGFLRFITYNGYWSLAGLGMLVYILKNTASANDILRKVFFTAVGFITPIILLFVLALVVGINLLTEYRIFSTTVSQGSYEEGWSLPFAYFWHAEHFVFIVLILLSLYAIFKSKGRDKTINLWAGAVIFIYLCLLIPSVYLHSFVVYGRLARQMMPFLVILSASGLIRLEQNYPSGQKLTQGILAVIFVQALWNYTTSFKLSYPREFAQQVQAQFTEFNFSEKRLTFGAPTLCQNNGFILENVKHFAVPPEANPTIRGELLLSAPHPDNFIAYQYEGYTYAERQVFSKLKPEMRFYKADVEFMSDTNPIWAEMKSCVVKEN